MTDSFLTEILEQPRVMHDAAAGLSELAMELKGIRATVRREPSRSLVITGMGSSFFAARAFASVLGRLGVPAHALNTAELIHFQLPAIQTGTVIVAVSQSGRSGEIVRLADVLGRRDDVTLIAITNDAGSPLAGAAQYVLELHAGVESGPSSKTFAATLVVFEALARLLDGSARTPRTVVDSTAADVECSAAGLAALLADAEEVAGALRAWASEVKVIALLGRGTGVASAELGALVLKEAAGVAAHGSDAAEFRHGPMELAGPGLGTVLVGLERATAGNDSRLRRDLAGPGTSIATIGSTVQGRPHVPVEPVTPLLDAAVAAVPLQLLAWSFARERPEPGRFLIGTKVTTEE